jgi:hypothetical protein
MMRVLDQIKKLETRCMLTKSYLMMVLLHLDELMVECAVAAGEVLQHPPEASILLAGLPELNLHRRHVRLITQRVRTCMRKDFHMCS